MYVVRHSENPKSTKDAIPYGLGIGGKTDLFSKTWNSYMEGKQMILQHMQNWGYKKKDGNKTQEKVNNLDWALLPQYK